MTDEETWNARVRQCNPLDFPDVLWADAELKNLREVEKWANRLEESFRCDRGGELSVDPYALSKLRTALEIADRARWKCECGANLKQCAENRKHHKIHLNRMGGVTMYNPVV